MSNENDKSTHLGHFTFDASEVLRTGAGILQINAERLKQIDKYQYTAKYQAEHPQYYADQQLQYAAHTLLNVDIMGYTHIVEPLNWDRAWFIRLCEKPQKDRIRIAAALLAAELDRLQYISDNNL